MPLNKVTYVERRRVWHSRFDPLDGATAAIVDGRFIYPRRGAVNLPFFIIIPVGKAIRKPNKN